MNSLSGLAVAAALLQALSLGANPGTSTAPMAPSVYASSVESRKDPSVHIPEISNWNADAPQNAAPGTSPQPQTSSRLLQPPSPNLVPNGDFEQVSANGLPAGWGKGGWGNNTRSYLYPAVMVDGGSKAAQVTMANRVTGDVKWFASLSLAPGTYRYRDEYISSVPSILTLQLRKADGSYSYRDLATLPARQRVSVASVLFSVPPGTTGTSVFHLIQQDGTLTMDNVSVRTVQPRGIFKTGGVTLRFDDGWQSQYDIALPKLQAAGMKATFYIVTRQTADNGFSGFMTKEEVRRLAALGHEVGAHTRTHPHLATLTLAEQRAEIRGSRDDLLAWKIPSVESFAYPFGEYTADTLRIVKNVGFSSAAAAAGGTVTISADPYQLKRRGVETATSLAQVQLWVQDVMANKEWLILEFHQVRTDCPDKYCTSPATFNAIVDYLAANKVPVVTVSDGARALAR